MPVAAKKVLTFALLLFAAVVGFGSLAAFFVFLYNGPFKLLDLGLADAPGLLLNTLLSLLFFLQHSGMVRRRTRRQLEKYLPKHYQGTFYTLMSGVMLIVLLVFWQQSDTVVLAVNGWPEIVMRGFFLLAVLGTIWGVWALHFVDLFGFRAVIRQMNKEAPASRPFIVRGPYRWVRHPLYLFTIILFWSYPLITLDRLWFNLLWTCWVVVGTRLEEGELAEDFGAEFQEYKSRVPMLLPRSIRPLY